MAIYGLSVYLETSKAQRRGRGPCIVISFLITGLTALTGCLEAPWAFRILFETPTEEAFYDVRDKYLHSGIKFLSMSAIQTVVVIGDGFLVILRRFDLTGTISNSRNLTGIPVLHDVVSS